MPRRRLVTGPVDGVDDGTTKHAAFGVAAAEEAITSGEAGEADGTGLLLSEGAWDRGLLS
jgi:hypothetical protein